MNKDKIIVGMSGGVDSSVTAYLLKQQGYEVEGVFMRNWQEDDEHCPATQDLNDAKAICALLDIPFHSISFENQYWDKVFQYFLDEYQKGRTPNPDILCNQEIKFKAFLDYALNELKADKIATGHYAKIIKKHDQVQLHKALDKNKEQSYFLYRLNQFQLSHAMFPLAEIPKEEVRKIAKQENFINHAKKDSTGICFIGERKFNEFLQQYLLAKPGPIISDQGDQIGSHQGLMFYTIGQRHGLNIGGLKNYPEAPWYVLEKDIEKNTLIIGQQQDHPKLYKQYLFCDEVHWIADQEPTLPLSCHCKIRYRQTDQACRLTTESASQIKVEFEQPQRAITSGQSVVFYVDTQCIGGGIII